MVSIPFAPSPSEIKSCLSDRPRALGSNRFERCNIKRFVVTPPTDADPNLRARTILVKKRNLCPPEINSRFYLKVDGILNKILGDCSPVLVESEPNTIKRMQARYSARKIPGSILQFRNSSEWYVGVEYPQKKKDTYASECEAMSIH